MLYLLTLFPIAGVAITLDYILFDNATNHTGLDYLSIALWSLSFCAILSFFFYKFKKEKNRRFLVPLVTNIAAILFFLFIDHFNIMVQYDDWLHRGMPGPFESSVMKKIEYPRELDVRVLDNLHNITNGAISREEYDRENALINIEIKKYKEQKKAKENDRN